MKTIDQYCSLKQSQRLKELGIIQGKLEMCWRHNSGYASKDKVQYEDPVNKIGRYELESKILTTHTDTFPALSCAELGLVLNRLHNIIPIKTGYIYKMPGSDAPGTKYPIDTYHLTTLSALINLDNSGKHLSSERNTTTYTPLINLDNSGGQYLNYTYIEKTEAMCRAECLINLIELGKVSAMYVNEVLAEGL